MACNDDGNNLLVLPAMETSIKDKILMLRCQRASIFDGITTAKGREELAARIASELPAFLHWLLHDYCAPDDMPRGRLGVAGWQHPDPIDKMYDLSPEAQVDGIITNLLFPSETTKKKWTGLESQLAAEIYADASAARQMSFIIGRGAISLRAMLNQLAEHVPARYARKRMARGFVWTILPPPDELEEFDPTSASDTQ